MTGDTDGFTGPPATRGAPAPARASVTPQFTGTVPADLADQLLVELRASLATSPSATHRSLEVLASLVATADHHTRDRTGDDVDVDDLLAAMSEALQAADDVRAEGTTVEHARGVVWALEAVRGAQRRLARQAQVLMFDDSPAPLRLRILALLTDHPATLEDLARQLTTGQDRVETALVRLREDGRIVEVEGERDGRPKRYNVAH